MLRCKSALAVLALVGLLTGWRMTQGQAQDKKDIGIKQPADPDTSKDDMRVVRENGFKGDGPELVEYFRKKTLKQPELKEISVLIKQLGDDDFPTRESAFTTLVGLGATKNVIEGIKTGETDPSLEVKKRVADLKARIDSKAEPAFQVAAARIVARVKPEGAAEQLLAFLPFASDANVVDEICRALGAVAVRNGTVEPVVVKSLEDALPLKRGAAGEALARAKEEIPSVKKLLKDPDALVRHRVCLAMLPLNDKAIVPVMIELLGELNPNQLWPIEEALLRLAGDKTPNVSLGNDAPGRKACRDAWAKWYAENEKNIDITKLSEGNVFLGYTLIVQLNNRIGPGGGGNSGEIFELDTEKNVRWKISLPAGFPVDAIVLGSGRVLIAEQQGGRVTERDFKGEIKWEYSCGGNPFSVQRLSNGNTFIAMPGRLIEVDRNKNEVWSHQRPSQDIMRAKKLPTGEVVFITNVGVNAVCTRLDPRTQKTKTFNMTGVQLQWGNIEVLANGNIIVPHYNNGRVVEYNQDGAQVGIPIPFNQVNSAVRLPSGNTLVASYQQRKVAEFGPGREVWTYQADGLVFVARRR